MCVRSVCRILFLEDVKRDEVIGVAFIDNVTRDQTPQLAVNTRSTGASLGGNDLEMLGGNCYNRSSASVIVKVVEKEGTTKLLSFFEAFHVLKYISPH